MLPILGSRGEVELNVGIVGIPCQVKLGERRMERECSIPMLHCSVEPRSRGELIWKKEMIALINYHWRERKQQHE